jgi:magnesium transporter
MNSDRLNKIIHRITFNQDKRSAMFLSLTIPERMDVLLRLTSYIQYLLLLEISEEEIAKTIENLDADDATDIVQVLPENKREKVISKINLDSQKEIRILSQFDPQTAGGIMNLGYIQVEADHSVSEISKKVKLYEKRSGRPPAIIVVEKGKLLGYLPNHELGFAHPAENILRYIRNIPSINFKASTDETVDLFQNKTINKIAVLDDKRSVIGVIYADDILGALKKQETAALYDFAGVQEEENVSDTARRKINFRYKWLIVNLVTAFLASFVISFFDATISKFVLLAIYMPIVAGMGGNAGTQTLAVVVRGITLEQINFGNFWPILKREVLAGFVNGIIVGVLVGAVVIVINRDFKIALILALAMVINLVIAAFFGTIMPLIMKKLGKDPASSATIFITTATDVLGFLAFLGLATIVL